MNTPANESTAHCSRCGQPLSEPRLEGICPACLWTDVFTEQPDEKVSGEGLEAAHLRSSTSASLVPIPGYEVREEIARGGMGIVYRAQQLEPSRTVALKMLLPHQVASAGTVERFRLEARAIASLEHPAILPVYHVGEHNGLPFFTMKLATGGTLAERRQQFDGNWRAIAELMATLADAVQFAHERGVLHRDLKPGNVLFDEAGRPYVSDFGLAKLVGKDSDLTRSIDLLGTPHYVSPEVAARSAKDATIASDIYSLGAILYELLAGRPPFEAEGIPALLKKIAEEEPLSPLAEQLKAENHRSRNHGVPRHLELICLKCLAKEPARRYAAMRDFANDLRRWLAGEPILARQTNTLEKFWLWSRRHRITAALIAAVVVLLVALLVGLSVASIQIGASRRQALRTVEALEAQKANELLAHDNTAEAIALLARRVRNDPDNWADVSRLMWALQRRRWSVPARAPTYPFPSDGADRTFLVRGSDRRLLALYVGTNVIVHDALGGTNRHVWPLPFIADRLRVVEKPGLIVLVDTNQQAWLFDFLTGQMRERPVPVLRSPIRLDHSGKRGFAVAPDGSGQLLDLQRGASRTLVPATDAAGRAHSPASLFLFPDGRRLVFTDRDRTVRIFDCVAGTLTGQVFVASNRIAGIDVSPDHRVMVTQSSEVIQFWDFESGRELPSRPEVGVSFESGAFRPDSSQFYQAGNASGLVIFEPLNGRLSKLPTRGLLLDGHCRAELAEPVTVRFERFVGVYNPETGQPLCQPIPVAQPIASAPRMVNGLCATLGFDGELTLWEVRTNRFEPVVLRHKGPIQHASFSPDGRSVVSASHDRTAQVWDASNGQPIGPPLKHDGVVWSACFSPDGKRVATASWDGSARIWDDGGAPLSPPLPANSYVFHVEFSPDGSRLLACGEDGVVRTYDANTGKPLLALPEKGPVYWAHFSPDGHAIVTRPFLAKPKIWDAAIGKLMLELDEPGPYARAAGVVTRGDFSPDGSWLALGSPNRYATLWHLPDGKLHAVLNHLAVVRTASFSPNGQTILTTADDLTGQLWDLKTGQPISSPLAGQRRAGPRANSGNSMRAAAIHPDSRRAITGGSDAAAHFWDLQNGLPLGEPAEFDGSVMHAEFSPDGKRVLLACFDGTAHIVPLPPVFDRAPAWLAPLAEALVGQRFDPRGATQTVSPTALWEVCEEIRRASPANEQANWARGVLGL